MVHKTNFPTAGKTRGWAVGEVSDTNVASHKAQKQDKKSGGEWKLFCTMIVMAGSVSAPSRPS